MRNYLILILFTVMVVCANYANASEPAAKQVKFHRVHNFLKVKYEFVVAVDMEMLENQSYRLKGFWFDAMTPSYGYEVVRFSFRGFSDDNRPISFENDNAVEGNWLYQLCQYDNQSKKKGGSIPTSSVSQDIPKITYRIIDKDALEEEIAKGDYDFKVYKKSTAAENYMVLPLVLDLPKPKPASSKTMLTVALIMPIEDCKGKECAKKVGDWWIEQEDEYFTELFRELFR